MFFLANPRKLVLRDMFRLGTPGAPVISPDGRFAAVSVTGYLEKENERMQSLYLVPLAGGAAHRLTRAKEGGTAPAFSADGTKLAFLSTRPDEPEVRALRPDKADAEHAEHGKAEPKDKPQVWLFDLELGGEPRQITHADEGVESFCWTPDGGEIIYAARAPRDGEKSYLKAVRDDEGPIVLRRVQHKMDGQGYLDEVRTQIFAAHVATREVHQLTDAPFSCRLPSCSPDGEMVAFVANCTGDEDQNLRRDVFLLRRGQGQAARLTRGDVDAACLSEPPVFSPDGRRVAFVSTTMPENAYLVTQLMVVDTAEARPIADLAAERGRGFASIGGIVPDNPAGDPVRNGHAYPVPLERTPVRMPTEGLDRPVLGSLCWLDDNSLAALVADRAQTKVARVSLTGGVEYLAPGGEIGSVQGMDARNGRIVATISFPDTGNEVYRLDPDGPLRLTSFQADVLQDVDHPRMERLTVPSADGVPVDALVLFPPGHAPHTPVPLIVDIHGGPMWYDSPQFDFDSVYFAQRGYAVLKVNYRGSISFGEAFCREIQGGWGPREHADVMACVDHLTASGDADPDRLYVTGFSQGGIMTNWAVGHTDRFRAAVSEHGEWEYVSAFGSDDCHLWWQDDLGVPWQNEAGYRAMSPAAAAADIRTPLLITAGQEDWRCPLDQAEQLYLTLRKRGVPTELVIYQGEHHAITKPKRAVDRIRRIGDWFARYGGISVDDDSAESYPDPQGAKV